jgi:hypothetical protein
MNDLTPYLIEVMNNNKRPRPNGPTENDVARAKQLKELREAAREQENARRRTTTR